MKPARSRVGYILQQALYLLDVEWRRGEKRCLVARWITVCWQWEVTWLTRLYLTVSCCLDTQHPEHIMSPSTQSSHATELEHLQINPDASPKHLIKIVGTLNILNHDLVHHQDTNLVLLQDKRSRSLGQLQDTRRSRSVVHLQGIP